MKKLILIFILFLLLAPTTLNAACPVCTVAAGASVGIFYWLGFDDLIVGLFLGALLVLLVNWIFESLKKKNKSNLLFQIIVVVVIYAGIIGSLYFLRAINWLDQMNNFNRLLFGLAYGSLVFGFLYWFTAFVQKKLRQTKAQSPRILGAMFLLIVVMYLFYYLFLKLAVWLF